MADYYRIEFLPAASKQFDKISRRDKQVVKKAIDKLIENPYHQGVEKLSGTDDLYRARAGKFRIIFSIQSKLLLVVIVRVGHRKDVYRQIQ